MDNEIYDSYNVDQLDQFYLEIFFKNIGCYVWNLFLLMYF